MNFNNSITGFPIIKQKNNWLTKKTNIIFGSLSVIAFLSVIFLIATIISNSKKIVIQKDENLVLKDILFNKIEELNVIKDNIYALQNESKELKRENEGKNEKLVELQKQFNLLSDKRKSSSMSFRDFSESVYSAELKLQKINDSLQESLYQKQKLEEKMAFIILMITEYKKKIIKLQSELSTK